MVVVQLACGQAWVWCQHGTSAEGSQENAALSSGPVSSVVCHVSQSDESARVFTACGCPVGMEATMECLLCSARCLCGYACRKACIGSTEGTWRGWDMLFTVQDCARGVSCLICVGPVVVERVTRSRAGSPNMGFHNIQPKHGCSAVISAGHRQQPT
jgi:hypothetical protein